MAKAKVGHFNRYLKVIVMLLWLLFLAWYHKQLVKITDESNEELVSPINEDQGKKQNYNSKKENNESVKATNNENSPTKYVRKESSPVQECDATGEVIDCCCPMACTDTIMKKSVGMFSCKQRIHWVMTTYALNLRDSCVRVAQVEYPNVCGSCDPDKCPVPVVTVHTNKYNEHIG